MNFKLLIVICLALLIPETIFAADLPSMINSIYSKIKTWLVSIGTLVIIGVCVYAYKNMDRWKEVGFQCVSIIIISLAIMNADTISNFIMKS